MVARWWATAMSETAHPVPAGDDTVAFVATTEEGITDLEADRTVLYEAVRRWLLSWGTDAEPPLPQCP